MSKLWCVVTEGTRASCILKAQQELHPPEGFASHALPFTT